MPPSAPSLNLSPAPTMSTSTPHVSSTIWLVMLDTQNNKYVLRTHAWRHLAILIKEFFCVRCLIEISRPTFCGPLIASWCTISCYAISSLPSLLHYFFFFLDYFSRLKLAVLFAFLFPLPPLYSGGPLVHCPAFKALLAPAIFRPGRWHSTAHSPGPHSAVLTTFSLAGILPCPVLFVF